MAKLSLSDFKRSNMILLIILAFAVLMFVFIPEFLGMAGKGSDLTKNISFELPQLKPDDGTSENKLENKLEQPIVEDGSSERLNTELEARAPLSQLEYLIDQGYIDYLVETRIQEKEKEVAVSVREKQAYILAEEGQKQQNSKDASFKFIPRNELNWSHLHSKESLKTLTDAKRKSTELLQKVPADYNQSRVALLSFISALNQVATDSKAFSSAKEALELLDRLDRNVTTTIAKDHVPRTISYDWSQISLATVIGTTRADRLKKALVPVYNPDPIIVHIVVSRDVVQAMQPAKDARISVKFVVNGDDFKEAELQRGSIVQKVLLYPTKVRKFQGREFPELLGDLLVPDIYTLVIKNTKGEEYKKVYNFTAPAYDQRNWVYDQRSNRYFLRLPYGRPNSPRLFEARFALQAESREPTNNLFDPTPGDEQVVSKF